MLLSVQKAGLDMLTPLTRALKQSPLFKVVGRLVMYIEGLLGPLTKSTTLGPYRK